MTERMEHKRLVGDAELADIAPKPLRPRFLYARGTERLTDARALLDMTPYGRQQDFENSPPGWPQKPTYG
jgi:predicted dithiol-disulfide oxidoreductase (DUF899 family)